MMDLQEVGGSCGDWMELAQVRDRWRALVGTVRNLHGVSKEVSIYLYIYVIMYVYILYGGGVA